MLAATKLGLATYVTTSLIILPLSPGIDLTKKHLHYYSVFSLINSYPVVHSGIKEQKFPAA